MKYIEKAGLVKYDILGLKTLTIISHTEKLIKSFKKDGGSIINIDQYLGGENSEELQQLQNVLQDNNININDININDIIEQIQNQAST